MGWVFLGKKTANQWLKIISVLNYTRLIKEVGIQVSQRKSDVSYVTQQQNVFSLFWTLLQILKHKSVQKKWIIWVNLLS